LHPRVHLAHAQFSVYGADRHGGHTSGADALVKYLHDHPRITADVGCIGFGPAMMISRELALAQQLAVITRQRPRYEHGWAVMPLDYDRHNAVNALQWAVELELTLLSQSLDRLSLSVDHPNGGPYSHMPSLMHLLSDRDARQAALAETHAWAKEGTALPQLDRELTDVELIELTRRTPANALGLTDKGHWAAGATADVVIANRPFARPRTVIKSGRIIL
jgi:formylmethanofuran dehydrogenase subunit A